MPPVIDPRDRGLLRPLKALGKPKAEASDISFLRRTQYTADDRRAGSDAVARSGSAVPTVKRRKTDNAREEPTQILRTVIKGFDIANSASAYKGPDTGELVRGHAPSAAELEAWRNPTHPSRPSLTMLESYPLVPDLGGAPDDGGYHVFKFTGNPTDAKTYYDRRMEVALLHQNERAPAARSEEQLARLAAHEADPAHHLYPILPSNYDFFLPPDADTASKMQRMLEVDFDPDDEASTYTSRREGAMENDSFRFAHVREYESGHIVDSRRHPYQEVALALHDGDEDGGAPKGAYFYAIHSKMQLKPRRNVNMASQYSTTDEEDKIDVVNVVIRDLNEEELQMRDQHKARLEGETAAS